MSGRNIEFWHFGRPTIPGAAEDARRCEALGYDGITLTDSQNLSPDTYVGLTLAAQATTTLQFGPGVTNPLTRHAAVTAGAIASIQEVSQGRAVLGLGRGDSSLFNIGYKPVTPAAFERYLGDLQTYLGGGTLDANGFDSRLNWLAGTGLPKVPVDVAATGPKVIAIAARHAERIALSLGCDPNRIANAIGQIRETVGPDGTMPSIGVYLNVCVHDDMARAVELARPGVGVFAHFTSMSDAARSSAESGDSAVYERLSDYDKAKHGSGEAHHAKALPLDFIQRFAVIGPAEVCIERLRAIRALDIDRMIILGPRVDHFGAEADTAQQRFAEQVMPALR